MCVAFDDIISVHLHKSSNQQDIAIINDGPNGRNRETQTKKTACLKGESRKKQMKIKNALSFFFFLKEGIVTETVERGWEGRNAKRWITILHVVEVKQRNMVSFFFGFSLFSA